MTYIHSDRFLYHTAPTEHNTLPLHDALPILARMRRLRAGISKVDSAESARKAGVDVFLGDGRFVSPDTIEVNGKRLRFRRAVIATGARAAEPPISGLAEAGFRTNETIFNLTAL